MAAWTDGIFEKALRGYFDTHQFKVALSEGILVACGDALYLSGCLKGLGLTPEYGMDQPYPEPCKVSVGRLYFGEGKARVEVGAVLTDKAAMATRAVMALRIEEPDQHAALKALLGAGLRGTVPGGHRGHATDEAGQECSRVRTDPQNDSERDGPKEAV